MLGGHKETVEILLNAGAKLSPMKRSELETQLRTMSYTANICRVQQLVECGICINATDYLGKTALSVASEVGNVKVIQYLLSMQAEADIQDKYGETAMSLAKRQNHAKIISLLQRAQNLSKKSSANMLNSAQRISRNPDDLNSRKNAKFTIIKAFPPSIASAILSGNEVQPIQKPMVSLLFSDICGFTKLSSTMEAGQVSSMLTDLFAKFDRLAHLHGVQKVDIVGDAYIAATNLMEEQPSDHAERLARFAADILEAARTTTLQQREKRLTGVPLRVGLHCGPVFGSVVSGGAARYTLIGDTVNVARTMESSGTPGRIQCSGEFARLVAGQANRLLLRRR